jgi:sugar O-acyltransferase (sialic acid O-acetyltransferase NeuD family)
MMAKLAILGASGHGKVVADTALQAGWDEVVFFDDAWPDPKTNGCTPVVGDTNELLNSTDKFAGVVVAIGNNRIRLGKAQDLLQAGLTLPPLIHPKAYVAKDVVIQSGVVIFAGAVVQPGSMLGLASIVNTGATVDHDCSLASGVHVCPGVNLAGGVAIGECSWIGIGSCVNQYQTIGADVTIGAGAAVVNDLPDDVTVVGIPAKAITRI